MKASRFSDAQKAFILKQGADGMPVADICRKAGISKATYFNWKKKYDGLPAAAPVSLFVVECAVHAGAGSAYDAAFCHAASIVRRSHSNGARWHFGICTADELPTEMRRLKQLEDENNKLRKVVADLCLDKEMLQDALRRKL